MLPLEQVAALGALAAAVSDARSGTIPDAVTLPMIALGAIAGSRAGLLACAIAPTWLFSRGKIGGGDVKLLAAIGALLGVRRGLLVEALALGGAVALGGGAVAPFAAIALAAIAR